MTASIIPQDTEIGQSLREAAQARVVMIVGLPSSGKSLMFQQMTILAHEAGRVVHTLQWDDARRSFETEEALAAYPEVDDLTHPGIRKAVGLWVRDGVAEWDRTNSDEKHLLLIELPVVGGRFIELLQSHEDAAEALLSSDRSSVLIPVPTNEMRRRIEGFREETFANPRNAEEEKDAPPYIVRDEWLATRRLYNRWNGIADRDDRDRVYDEEINRAVFARLCRFRQTRFLNIDRAFDTTGSAYERPVPVTKVQARPEQVTRALAHLEKLFPGQAAERATDGWFDY